MGGVIRSYEGDGAYTLEDVYARACYIGDPHATFRDYEFVGGPMAPWEEDGSKELYLSQERMGSMVQERSHTPEARAGMSVGLSRSAEAHSEGRASQSDRHRDASQESDL